MAGIRLAGYRGYLPIETLSAAGQAYDPFEVVPKFLAEIRQAVEATASVASPPAPEEPPPASSATTNPATTDLPDSPPPRKPANKSKSNARGRSDVQLLEPDDRLAQCQQHTGV